MKTLVICAAIGCISVLSACDSEGSGTVVSCATSMVGSYASTTGEAQSGSVIGQLVAEPDDPATGTLTVWMPLIRDGAVDQREFRATVDGTTGTLIPNSQSLILSGEFDLNACSASGTWDFFGQLQGDWEVNLPEHTGF